VIHIVDRTVLGPRPVMAVGYYDEHREEIDAWIREEDEHADRAYSEWQQQQKGKPS
jgi:hypothetical protein